MNLITNNIKQLFDCRKFSGLMGILMINSFTI